MGMPEPVDPWGFWATVKDLSIDTLWPPDDEDVVALLATALRGAGRGLEVDTYYIDVWFHRTTGSWPDGVGELFRSRAPEVGGAYREQSPALDAVAAFMEAYRKQIIDAKNAIRAELETNLALFVLFSFTPGLQGSALALAAGVALKLGRLIQAMAAAISRIPLVTKAASAAARALPAVAKGGVKVGGGAVDEAVIDIRNQQRNVADGIQDDVNLGRTGQAMKAGALGEGIGEGLGKLAEPVTDAARRGLNATGAPRWVQKVGEHTTTAVSSAANNGISSPTANYLIQNEQAIGKGDFGKLSWEGYGNALREQGLAAASMAPLRSNTELAAHDINNWIYGGDGPPDGPPPAQGAQPPAGAEQSGAQPGAGELSGEQGTGEQGTGANANPSAGSNPAAGSGTDPGASTGADPGTGTGPGTGTDAAPGANAGGTPPADGTGTAPAGGNPSGADVGTAPPGGNAAAGSNPPAGGPTHSGSSAVADPGSDTGLAQSDDAPGPGQSDADATSGPSTDAGADAGAGANEGATPAGSDSDQVGGATDAAPADGTPSTGDPEGGNATTGDPGQATGQTNDESGSTTGPAHTTSSGATPAVENSTSAAETDATGLNQSDAPAIVPVGVAPVVDTGGHANSTATSTPAATRARNGQPGAGQHDQAGRDPSAADGMQPTAAGTTAETAAETEPGTATGTGPETATESGPAVENDATPGPSESSTDNADQDAPPVVVTSGGALAAAAATTAAPGQAPTATARPTPQHTRVGGAPTSPDTRPSGPAPQAASRAKQLMRRLALRNRMRPVAEQSGEPGPGTGPRTPSRARTAFHAFFRQQSDGRPSNGWFLGTAFVTGTLPGWGVALVIGTWGLNPVLGGMIAVGALGVGVGNGLLGRWFAKLAQDARDEVNAKQAELNAQHAAQRVEELLAPDATPPPPAEENQALAAMRKRWQQLSRGLAKLTKPWRSAPAADGPQVPMGDLSWRTLAGLWVSDHTIVGTKQFAKQWARSRQAAGLTDVDVQGEPADQRDVEFIEGVVADLDAALARIGTDDEAEAPADTAPPTDEQAGPLDALAEAIGRLRAVEPSLAARLGVDEDPVGTLVRAIIDQRFLANELYVADARLRHELTVDQANHLRQRNALIKYVLESTLPETASAEQEQGTRPDPAEQEQSADTAPTASAATDDADPASETEPDPPPSDRTASNEPATGAAARIPGFRANGILPSLKGLTERLIEQQIIAAAKVAGVEISKVGDHYQANGFRLEVSVGHNENGNPAEYSIKDGVGYVRVSPKLIASTPFFLRATAVRRALAHEIAEINQRVVHRVGEERAHETGRRAEMAALAEDYRAAAGKSTVERVVRQAVLRRHMRLLAEELRAHPARHLDLSDGPLPPLRPEGLSLGRFPGTADGPRAQAQQKLYELGRTRVRQYWNAQRVETGKVFPGEGGKPKEKPAPLDVPSPMRPSPEVNKTAVLNPKTGRLKRMEERNRIGLMIALVLDPMTGEVFEVANGPRKATIPPGELHPKLRERGDALQREDGYPNTGYDNEPENDGPARRDLPGHDLLYRHAEVKAVNMALHANPMARISDLVIHVESLSEEGTHPAACCPNCSALLHDATSNFGKRGYDPGTDSYRDEPGPFDLDAPYTGAAGKMPGFEAKVDRTPQAEQTTSMIEKVLDGRTGERIAKAAGLAAIAKNDTGGYTATRADGSTFTVEIGVGTTNDGNPAELSIVDGKGFVRVSPTLISSTWMRSIALQRALSHELSERPGPDLFSRTPEMSNAEVLASGEHLPLTEETVRATAAAVNDEMAARMDRVDVVVVTDPTELKYFDDEKAAASTTLVNGVPQIRFAPASMVDGRTLAATIGHEMTHVDQLLDGRGREDRQTLEDEAEAAEAPAVEEYDEHVGGQVHHRGDVRHPGPGRDPHHGPARERSGPGRDGPAQREQRPGGTRARRGVPDPAPGGHRPADAAHRPAGPDSARRGSGTDQSGVDPTLFRRIGPPPGNPASGGQSAHVVRPVSKSRFTVDPQAKPDWYGVLRYARAAMTRIVGDVVGVLDVTPLDDIGNFKVTRDDKARSVFQARVVAEETRDGAPAEVVVTGPDRGLIRVSPRAGKDIVDRAVASALAQLGARLAGNDKGRDLLDRDHHPGDAATPSAHDVGRETELAHLARTKQEAARYRVLRRRRIAAEWRALVEDMGVHPEEAAGPQRRAVVSPGTRDLLDKHAGAGTRRPSWVHEPSGYTPWKAFIPAFGASIIPGLSATGAIATLSVINNESLLVAAAVGVMNLGTAVAGTLVARWYGRREKDLVDAGHGYFGKVRAHEVAVKRRALMNPLLARMRTLGIDVTVPGPSEPPPTDPEPARLQPYKATLVSRALPPLVGAIGATALLPLGLPFWNLMAHWGIAGFAGLFGPTAERYFRARMVLREWKWFDAIGRELDRENARFDEEFAKKLHALMDRVDRIAGTTSPNVAPVREPIADTTVAKDAANRYGANSAPNNAGDFSRDATNAPSRMGNAVQDAISATGSAALDAVGTGLTRFGLGVLVAAFLDRKFTRDEYAKIVAQVRFDFGATMVEQAAQRERALLAMLAEVESRVEAAEAAAHAQSSHAEPRAVVPLPPNPAARPPGHRDRHQFRLQGVLQGAALWGITIAAADMFNQGHGPVIVVGAAAFGVLASFPLRFLHRRAEQRAVDRKIFADRAKDKVVEAAESMAVRGFMQELINREVTAAERVRAAGLGPVAPDPVPAKPNVPAQLDSSDPAYPDHIEALAAHERELILRDPRPLSTLGARLVALQRLDRLAARTRLLGRHESRTGNSAPARRARIDLAKTWAAYQKLVADGTAMPYDHELYLATKHRVAEQLRSYLDQSTPIPGGRMFFAPGDPLLTDRLGVRQVDGVYTIDAHGVEHGPDGVGLRVGAHLLTVEHLSAILDADPNYDGGPIRLLVCESGRGEDSFAQRLADRRGQPVTAPTKVYGVDDNGTEFVTDVEVDGGGVIRPKFPPTGEMRTFEPRKNNVAHLDPDLVEAPIYVGVGALDSDNRWRLRGGDTYQPSERERALAGRKIVRLKLLRSEKADNKNETFLAVLDDGTRAVFKPTLGEQHQLREHITRHLGRREVAASRVDEMFGFGLVPTTTMIDDNWTDPGPVTHPPGSLQRFVENAREGWQTHQYTTLETQRTAVLDYIIGNLDRNIGNYLTGPNGELIAIDHNLAFPEHAFNAIMSDFIRDHLGAHLDPEVARAVAEVAPAELRTMLLSTGLSPAAVDLAVARLVEIQEHGMITGEAWAGKLIDSAQREIRRDQPLPPPLPPVAPDPVEELLQDLLDDSVAYQGGRALFAPGDPFRDPAHRVPNHPDAYTIEARSVHGDVRVDTLLLDAEHVAWLVEADDNWDWADEQPLRLVANVNDEFARRLTDRLGVIMFVTTRDDETGELGATRTYVPRHHPPSLDPLQPPRQIDEPALDSHQPSGFTNQQPERLNDELEVMRRNGVVPTVPGTPEFDTMISSGDGRLKWVVMADGEFRVAPHNVNEEEISHAAIAGGGKVRAAGQANVAGSSEAGYFGLDIDNHSGHYFHDVPHDADAVVQDGVAAFGRYGVPDNFERNPIRGPG